MCSGGTLKPTRLRTLRCPSRGRRSHGRADEVPALADLTLSRYLLEDSADPFLVDAETWLNAAESIRPRSAAIYPAICTS